MYMSKNIKSIHFNNTYHNLAEVDNFYEILTERNLNIDLLTCLY